MRRAWALAVLAALAGLTAASLALPWPVGLALVAASLVILPSGRAGFLAFTLVAIAINALILAAVTRSTASIDLGFVALGADGALAGAAAGIRLSGALGVNLAVIARIRPARLIDAMGLPPRAVGTVAAVLLAAQDVGRDFARLRDARRLDGDWPRSRLAAARAAASLTPALLLLAERRAASRRDALRLAGHDASPLFVPLVAVAALGAAGRMALLALPNVALTYVVVFLGGMLYGWRVGAAGGALAMALTDFLLSGLYPLGFVNVPAMALVGVAGAAMRRVDFDGASRADRAAGTVFAFAAGAGATIAFSLATDALTWLLGLQGAQGALAPILVAGLAFNVLPAIGNGLVFAFAVRPVLRAHRAIEEDDLRRRKGAVAPAVSPA